jgi:Fe-S cluster biogenesis protein NfuA
MAENSIEIKLEFTPNPMTLKYVFSTPLKVDDTNYYLSKKEAESYSPMASAIFGVDTVAAVMICSEFISVTYSDMNIMRDAHESVIHVVKAQLEKGEDICTPRPTDDTTDDDPTVTKIKEILEADIRPALARDGGDISFIRYQDGKLFVTMMGACSGCPHSAMTLKNGVLQRIQEELPEVQEIVSV